MQGFIFRRAKPAIVGVDVLAGQIRAKYQLVKTDGTDLGDISQIQDKGETIPQARTGMQVAISLEKPIVGRHIEEKDILYVKVPEPHAKLLRTKFLEKLTIDEQEALEEYVKLMQKKIPFWSA
jgi:translation initiation factor 5B